MLRRYVVLLLLLLLGAPAARAPNRHLRRVRVPGGGGRGGGRRHAAPRLGRRLQHAPVQQPRPERRRPQRPLRLRPPNQPLLHVPERGAAGRRPRLAVRARLRGPVSGGPGGLGPAARLRLRRPPRPVQLRERGRHPGVPQRGRDRRAAQLCAHYEPVAFFGSRRGHQQPHHRRLQHAGHCRRERRRQARHSQLRLRERQHHRAVPEHQPRCLRGGPDL